MAQDKNWEVRKDIIEALDAGLGIAQIAELIGKSYESTSQLLYSMMSEGLVERLGRGEYRAVHNGGVISPAPAETRRVDLPAYIKTRSAVTVFVERSPSELEGVVRLEIQIGGHWFPSPIQGDIRICIGDDVPRWSATQETYQGVTAYRITLRNGEQNHYAHAANIPFTVDAK